MRLHPWSDDLAKSSDMHFYIIDGFVWNSSGLFIYVAGLSHTALAFLLLIAISEITGTRRNGVSTSCNPPGMGTKISEWMTKMKI
jgi:hypothetical protein